MDNLTAYDIEDLVGDGNLYPLNIGVFQFFIYAGQDINAPYGKGRLFIQLHEKGSPFENTINFDKQTVDTNRMIKHIKKELLKLNKIIAKELQ